MNKLTTDFLRLTYPLSHARMVSNSVKTYVDFCRAFYWWLPETKSKEK